ncbi:MAG: sialate O-acetylesterase [Granulosicoccus sp.]
MKRTVPHPTFIAVCLMAALFVSACDSNLDDGLDDDVQPPETNGQTEGGEPGVGAEGGESGEEGNETGEEGGETGEGEETGEEGEETGEGEETEPPEVIETGSFSLDLETLTIDMTEGGGLEEVSLTLERTGNHRGDVSLSAIGASAGDELLLTRQFSDDTLSDDEQQSTLLLDLAIGARPILAQERTLLVSGTDAEGTIETVQLTVQVQPTDRPDIYLLVGQSNMIGVSENNAKRAGPGEPDEPVARIRQLNVTGNDDQNFSNAADFTRSRNIHNQDNPLTVAVDPLHSGLESNGGKSGTLIGMGLSFAKRASQDTIAEIFLVPAAWSDTGFCRRNSNRVEGIGWNATEKDVPELSGTLLHDRAIARADIAIDRTGGILRGIIWHQGEADSSVRACSELYAQNLAEMAQSFRTNIRQDARGSVARGPDVAIPFIVGTMAMGGSQAPFSETKSMVDAAHRNVSNTLSFADFVNADDLVPPAFACGGGSCIHFGADALRELGVRYYERLISVLP